MNRQSQVVSHRAGVGAAALPASSYWKHIVSLAALMIMVIGARAHEGLPIVSKLRPALLLGVFGCGLAIVRTKKEVIRRALNEPIFRACAMYVGWAAVGVPLAMWIGGSIKAIQAVIPALALVLVVLMCPPTLEVVNKLLRGFAFGCFGTAVISAAHNTISGEGRLTGNGSFDSNDLAAVMAMSLPLILGLVSREKSTVRRLFWLAGTAVVLYVFMKAGSRGGMIAILVAAVVFVAGQRGARRPIFFAILVAAGFASWGLGSARFHRKVIAMLQGEQDYNYTDYHGRKQVWARARGYTIHNPVFGLGVGNFPVAEGEACRRDFPDQGCKWSAPHNAYLQASSELGIPGAIFFALMLATGARSAFGMWVPRRSPEGMHMPELLASLLGFSTAAVFLSHAYFYLLFALLGVIGIAERTRLERRAALRAGRSPDTPALAANAGVRPPARRPFGGVIGGRPAARPTPRPFRPMPGAAQAMVPHPLMARRPGPGPQRS